MLHQSIAKVLEAIQVSCNLGINCLLLFGIKLISEVIGTINKALWLR